MRRLRFNIFIILFFLLLVLSSGAVLVHMLWEQEEDRNNVALLEHGNNAIRIITETESVAYEYAMACRNFLRDKDSLNLFKAQLAAETLGNLSASLHELEEKSHVSHPYADTLHLIVLKLIEAGKLVPGVATPDKKQPVFDIKLFDTIRKKLDVQLQVLKGLSQNVKSQETVFRDEEVQRNSKEINYLSWILYFILGGTILLAGFILLRLRKEYSLREKKEKEFANLLESTPDATIITDEEGRLVMVNKQATVLFGYTREELLEKKVEQLMPESFRKQHVKIRQNYNEKPHNRPMTSSAKELKAFHKSGRVIPVEISLSPISTAQGKLTVASVRDITQRKEVDEQIRQLYTQINKAGEAIYVTDESLVIRTWNKGAELLYGFTEAEAIGEVSLKLLDTTLTDAEMEQAHIEITRDDYWAGDILRHHKNGKELHVRSSLSAIRDLTGKITGYVSVSHDITEERRLQEERGYLASITEQMSEAVLSHRADNKALLTWNKGAEKLFGFTAVEAIGKSIEELGLIRFTETESEWLEQELLRNGHWRLEKEFTRKDGSILTGSITATVLKDISGHVLSFVYLIQDVTAEKMLGEAIRTYNEELEQQVEARTNEIRENEAQYRYMFENNPMPMWVFEVENLQFLDVNKMAILKYGYSREEFLQMRLSDIRPESEKIRFRNFDHAWQMNITETNRGVWKHCKKNGEVMDVEIFAHSIIYKGVKAKIILLNDVTNRLQTERMLQASEKKFRALIENSTDLIAMVDMEGKLLYRSPSAERITGWPEEELHQRNFIELLVHPDEREHVAALFKEVMEKPGVPVAVQYRSLHHSGHYIHLEGVWINLLHRDFVKAVVFNMRDVTIQRNAEQQLMASEKKFRSLIENSYEIIVLLDENCKIIYRSPSAERLTGRSNNETVGTDPRAMVHPDDVAKINEGFARLLQHPGNTENVIFRFPSLNGEIVWMEGNATNLLHDPDVNAIVFNYRDVTERIIHETKLKESEERFRLTLDNMFEGVQIIGFDGRYKYVNNSVAEQAHTTREELQGALMTDKFPGIENTPVYELIQRCLKERVTFQLENHFVLPDGYIIWTQLSIQPVPEGVFILSVDITEKKKAAEALRIEEEKLASVAASSPGVIYSFRMGHDGQYSFPYISEGAKDVFGFDIKLASDQVNALMEQTIIEDKELFMHSMLDSAMSLQPWKLEFRYQHPEKGIIWLEGSSVPSKEPDGSIIWHGVIMDVTERKMIQQKINEQAARIRTLTDNLPGVMIFQITGNSFEDRHFSYVSNEVVHLCGSQPEEVIANPGLLYNRILEEDIPGLIAAEEEAFKHTSIFNQEVRVRDLQDNIRWVNIVSTPRKNENGQFVWDGFYLDITERKNSENVIRESEERYRTLVEQAFDGILFYDKNGHILDCNNSGAATMGYTREEMLQLNVSALFYEDDLQIHPLNIPKVLSDGQVFDFRTMRRKDGSPVEIELVTRILPDGRFLAVGRDISDQNKALSQQSLLSSIVNSSDDAIISTDIQGKVTSWNKGAEHIYGYKAEEMMGRNTDLVVPAEMLITEKSFEQRIGNGEFLQHYETARIRKDGVRILVSITESPLVDNRGRITGVSKVVRDITRQRGAEIRIRESNERYEAVAKATSDAIWDFDYQTMKTFIAGTGYKYLFGYPLVNQFSPPEFWEERLHPDDKPFVLAKMDQVKKSKGVMQSSIEYRFRKADGTYAYVNDRFFIIRDAEGHPLRLLGAKQDITSQKEAEEALRRNAEEKQLLYDRLSVILNTLPASVALLDPKGIMVEVNDSWKSFAFENGFSDVNYGIGSSYLTVSTLSFGDKEEDGLKIAEGIRSVLNGSTEQFAFEYSWQLAKEKHWFRMVVTPLSGIEFSGAVVMNMDISEIRRLEQERVESRIEEQKKITDAMLRGQEKERNAIGIELHDNVNQILVGTKVLLSVVKDYPEKIDELIPNCIENISSAIQENRKIAHELVTPNLNNESLKQQIDRLAQTMLKNAGISTYINHESLNEALLTTDMKLALYRVAQEQCTNIIKYAKAEQVIISMATKNDSLIMRIADDGVGMDQQQLSHGIGLKNISSRLGVLGGTINIDTAPGQGFALEIELPLVPDSKAN